MARKAIPKANPDFVGENNVSNPKTGKKMKNTKNNNNGANSALHKSSGGGTGGGVVGQ